MANQYLYDLTDSWSGGGTFNAIKMNVTDGGSNAASKLLDLQVGGSSLVSVTKDGQVRLPLGSSATPSLRFGTTEGMYIKDAAFVFQPNNNALGGIAISQSTIFLPPSFTIGWQPSAGNPTQGPDTVIVRDGAAGTLAQRNAANAQTFNIYNTYSSSTSYERLSIIAQSNDAVRIVTNKGSGGGAARALELGTDGTTRLTISTGGNVILNTSAAGIQMPSNGYFTLNGVLTAPSDGVWRLTNTSQNDWGRLQFGGTTSSFPALKRSSATLICRLADDSANAAFESASLKTDAPAGGTAATWKLGTVASVSPTSPDRTIEVDIGGTIYYIHAKTTNN